MIKYDLEIQKYIKQALGQTLCGQEKLFGIGA